jgi:hypothetical protein
MSADIAKLNAADAMKTVMLNVELDTRELRVRLWIGERILRLAARVLNCGIQIKVSKTGYPPLPEPLPPPPPPPPAPGERWRK